MLRKLLFVSVLLWSMLVGAPAGHAAQCASIMSSSPPGTPEWVGVLRFVKQSAACGGTQYFDPSQIARSTYRPYLTSGNNPSGLTHYLGSNHSMLITNLSPTGQFSGRGTYRLCGIDNEAEFGGPINGTYAFTQTPTIVDASTTVITLDGHINRYANVSGCTLYFQGAYVRDPQN